MISRRGGDPGPGQEVQVWLEKYAPYMSSSSYKEKLPAEVNNLSPAERQALWAFLLRE
ncbi:hypothetical protein [Methanothrix sp.]|uniref:hypothetical protein n=1 Tax=Methanothrix sp. TaxID=90426 RepID=UPI0025E0B620|nr:hypothetical protein [Methanothrix sp.]